MTTFIDEGGIRGKGAGMSLSTHYDHVQDLYIVSRDHPEMRGRVMRQFWGDDSVQVIFDRRYAERRRSRSRREPERRHGDRRFQSGGAAGLRELGYVRLARTG